MADDHARATQQLERRAVPRVGRSRWGGQELRNEISLLHDERAHHSYLLLLVIIKHTATTIKQANVFFSENLWERGTVHMILVWA